MVLLGAGRAELYLQLLRLILSCFGGKFRSFELNHLFYLCSVYIFHFDFN